MCISVNMYKPHYIVDHRQNCVTHAKCLSYKRMFLCGVVSRTLYTKCAQDIDDVWKCPRLHFSVLYVMVTKCHITVCGTIKRKGQTGFTFTFLLHCLYLHWHKKTYTAVHNTKESIQSLFINYIKHSKTILYAPDEMRSSNCPVSQMQLWAFLMVNITLLSKALYSIASFTLSKTHSYTETRLWRFSLT